jgi:hypothetical protein
MAHVSHHLNVGSPKLFAEFSPSLLSPSLSLSVLSTIASQSSWPDAPSLFIPRCKHLGRVITLAIKLSEQAVGLLPCQPLRVRLQSLVDRLQSQSHGVTRAIRHGTLLIIESRQTCRARSYSPGGSAGREQAGFPGAVVVRREQAASGIGAVAWFRLVALWRHPARTPSAQKRTRMPSARGTRTASPPRLHCVARSMHLGPRALLHRVHHRVLYRQSVVHGKGRVGGGPASPARLPAARGRSHRGSRSASHQRVLARAR